jgi:hypothetical protein
MQSRASMGAPWPSVHDYGGPNWKLNFGVAAEPWGCAPGLILVHLADIADRESRLGQRAVPSR